MRKRKPSHLAKKAGGIGKKVCKPNGRRDWSARSPIESERDDVSVTACESDDERRTSADASLISEPPTTVGSAHAFGQPTLTMAASPSARTMVLNIDMTVRP